MADKDTEDESNRLTEVGKVGKVCPHCHQRFETDEPLKVRLCPTCQSKEDEMEL